MDSEETLVPRPFVFPMVDGSVIVEKIVFLPEAPELVIYGRGVFGERTGAIVPFGRWRELDRRKEQAVTGTLIQTVDGRVNVT
jgi:hypothetical protein